MENMGKIKELCRANPTNIESVEEKDFFFKWWKKNEE